MLKYKDGQRNKLQRQTILDYTNKYIGHISWLGYLVENKPHTLAISMKRVILDENSNN